MKLRHAENRIIIELLEHGKCRWSGLKDKTGLSDRGLSLNLKRLVEKKIVERTVDSAAKEAPVPIYYRLIENAAMIDEIRILAFNVISLPLIDKPKVSATDESISDEKWLKMLGNKVAAYYLYAVIKQLETGENYFDKAASNEYLNKMLPAILTGRAFRNGKIDVVKNFKIQNRRDPIHPKLLIETLSPPKERVQELKKTLMKLYPEEFKTLNLFERMNFKRVLLEGDNYLVTLLPERLKRAVGNHIENEMKESVQ